MKSIISLIFIFEDKKYDQHDPEYIKILLDSHNQIPRLDLTDSYTDIKDCLKKLYNDFIRIDYDWPDKELIDCRINNSNELEIIYKVYMPYISDSVKSGNLINITDFPSTVLDDYYVECITSNFRRFG